MFLGVLNIIFLKFPDYLSDLTQSSGHSNCHYNKFGHYIECQYKESWLYYFTFQSKIQSCDVPAFRLAALTLTHCSRGDFSTLIYWKSSFSTLGVLGVFFQVYLVQEKNCLANSGDPDQMLHYGASDLGLHCLPVQPF